jgi:hypothetical protein
VGCGVETVEATIAPARQLRLSVVPNPVVNYAVFSWGSDQLVSSVKIYDTNGRLVEEVESSPGGCARWMRATDLPSGVYFARVIAGGSSWVNKFALSR